MSLKTFIQSLRKSPPRAIVTGNQSADMDSCVSAFAYAYFSAKKQVPLVPLINIPRDEFRLRRDIVKLFKQHDIDEGELFFVDDLPDLFPQGSVPIHLVDHNNFQGAELIKLDEEGRLDVVGIIDHHADEGRFTNANPREIGIAGSCSSRVWEYWHRQLGAQAEETEIVTLLTGPLLIDTGNMTQKVESVDTKAIHDYTTIINRPGIQSGPSMEVIRDQLYPEYKKAKKEVSGFSVGDMLRKDYKQFDFNGLEFGFSSTSKRFAWYEKKYTQDEINEGFKGLARQYHLDFIIVTTSFTDKNSGNYSREFGIVSPAGKTFPCDYAISKLELTPNSAVHMGDMKVYVQGDISASRKQIVPIVKDMVERHL